jgi:hypothetical protein
VAFSAAAEEEATFSAAVYPAAEIPARDELLVSSGVSEWGPATDLSASGTIRPYRAVGVRLSGTLAPGRYVYAIRIAARFNPERSSLFVSRPFSVR